jgi:hypothetical protein
MQAGTVGTRCVRCLQVIVLQRTQCPVCSYPGSPSSFTMTYGARFRRQADSAFRKDAPRLALSGYKPLPGKVVWAPAARGRYGQAAARAAFGILGSLILMFVPPPGSLSVIYGRSDLTPEQALARADDAISWSN